MRRRHADTTIDDRSEPDHVAVVDEPMGGRLDERSAPLRSMPPPVGAPATPEFTDRSTYDATVTRQRISLASVSGALAGLALLIVGIIAMLRGGLGGPLDEPVVEVLGFTHTPLLGVIDVVVGLLLLGAAAAASRSALTFLGLVAVVVGAVALAEPGELAERLAVERAFGWAWVIGGGLVALAAWLLPVYERETRRVRHREDTV